MVSFSSKKKRKKKGRSIDKGINPLKRTKKENPEGSIGWNHGYH